MAKTVISTRVEDALLDQMRAIQERNRWSFQTAIELAVEQFVAGYAAVELPNLAAAPDAAPRVITLNGVTYTQNTIQEAA